MKPSVLVVDFDPRSLRVTRGLLEARGIQTSSAASAAELDAVLGRGAPPVVLLDPMLPGRDGFEVCRTLKDGPEEETPTVFVASRIFRGQRYRTLARNAGADAFFERPKEETFLLQEISRVWDAVLAESEAADAAEAADSAPVVLLDELEESGSHEPPLEGITDNEIDDALFRALGASEQGSESLFAGVGGGSSAQETPPADDHSPVAAAAPLGPAEPLPDGAAPAPIAAAVAEAPSAPTPDEEVAPARAAAGVASAPLFDQADEASSAVEEPAPLAEPEGVITDPVVGGEVSAAGGGGPAAASVSSAGLWASLDRLELQVAESTTSTRPNVRPIIDPVELEKTGTGSAHRVIDSPVGFDESEMHAAEEPSAALSAPQPELALETGRSGVAAIAEAEPQPSAPDGGRNDAVGVEQAAPAAKLDLEDLVAERQAPSAPIGNPSSIEAMIDNVIAFAPAAASPAGPGLEGDAKGVAGDVAEEATGTPDAILSEDGIHLSPAGETPPEEKGEGAGDKSSSKKAEPAPGGDEEEFVPPELEGMDAGTADLLSTLEELESSLPPESIDVENTSTGEWTGGGLTGELKEDLDTAISLDSPPSAEEESSLESLLDQISAEQSSSSPVSSPVLDAAPLRSRGGLLAGLAVAGLLLGAGGYWWIGGGDRLLAGWSDAGDGVARIARVMPRQAFRSAAVETLSGLPERGEAGALATLPEPSAMAVSGQTVRRVPDEAPAAIEAEVPAEMKRPAPRTASARIEQQSGSAGPESRNRPVPATSVASRQAAPVAARPRPEEAATTDAPEETRPAPDAAGARLNTRTSPHPDRAALLEKPPEPPAAPNPLEPVAPLVRLADLDYPLRLLDANPPRLTPEAREAGRGGRVFLNLLVGPDGRVKDARVMMEPGLGLGRAALRAVRRWRYSPPRHNGEKARVWKTEVIDFRTTGGAG